MTGIVINSSNSSLYFINLAILIVLQFMLGIDFGNLFLQIVNKFLGGFDIIIALKKVILTQSSNDFIQFILLYLNLCCIVVVQSFLSLHQCDITNNDSIDFVVGGINCSSPLAFSSSRITFCIKSIVLSLGVVDNTILFHQLGNSLVLPVLIVCRRQLGDSLLRLCKIISLCCFISSNYSSVCSFIALDSILIFLKFRLQRINLICSRFNLTQYTNFLIHNLGISEVISFYLIANCLNTVCLQLSNLCFTCIRILCCISSLSEGSIIKSLKC